MAEKDIVDQLNAINERHRAGQLAGRDIRLGLDEMASIAEASARLRAREPEGEA